MGLADLRPDLLGPLLDGGRQSRFPRRRRPRGQFCREIHHKFGSLAGAADQLNFAAQQLAQLARDGQAQAGAAVLAAGGSIRLPEGLEDESLLLEGNADAAVADRESQGLGGAQPAGREVCAGPRPSDRQGHSALFRELECIRQQVLQNLFQTLRVGQDHGRQIGRNLGPKVELLFPGERLEQPGEIVAQLAQTEFFDPQFHLARLDLGQIEDFVDQFQQVRARRVDRPGELALLGGQVQLLVFTQQLREDQDAVQRRAQLVRHVRQELGLVLARRFQIPGLAFQFLPRQVDLGILLGNRVALLFQGLGPLFEFFVGDTQLLLLSLQLRLGELQRPGLFFQFLIRHPQLFLLRLQFLVGGLQFFLLHQQLLRLLLGLFQQPLRGVAGAGRGDGDADALADQLQQFLGRPFQRSNARQFEHAHYPLARQQGHNHDVSRDTLAQAGRDPDIVRGHVGQQDAAFLQRGLADQALAQVKLVRQVLPLLVAVASQQTQGAVLQQKDAAHLDIQILGQELERLAADGSQLQIAAERIAQDRLAGFQPILPLVGRRGLAQRLGHAS